MILPMVTSYSVSFPLSVTWVQLSDYREWLTENAPGWEFGQRRMYGGQWSYTVEFKSPEDATAFKLRFSLGD